MTQAGMHANSRVGELLTAAGALLVVVAIACSPDAPSANGDAARAQTVPDAVDTAPPAPADPATAPAPADPQPDESWLTHQPRMEELRRRTPADLGWTPGTTPWRESRRAVPDRLSAGHVRAHGGAPSPGEAMAVLMLEARVLDEMHFEGRQEVTIRATQTGDDTATGVLLYWGALDDSVAGSDLRASLRAVDGAWYVERLEERYHCARGVTAEGTCI